MNRRTVESAGPLTLLRSVTPDGGVVPAVNVAEASIYDAKLTPRTGANLQTARGSPLSQRENHAHSPMS